MCIRDRITAILLVMTFWARPDWPQNGKIIYMVITYCLLVLGYTCVNIPYGTLCGAMTQNENKLYGITILVKSNS